MQTTKNTLPLNELSPIQAVAVQAIGIKADNELALLDEKKKKGLISEKEFEKKLEEKKLRAEKREYLQKENAKLYIFKQLKDFTVKNGKVYLIFYSKILTL